MKKEYNVSVIGLEIDNGNLGCVALTLSFINILEQIGMKLGVTLSLTAVGYSDKKYECNDIVRKYEVIRVHPKQLSFWTKLKQNFKNADIIFDFTLGDSFSDIYGAGRYIKTNLLKEAAEKYNDRFILGPQTYGPYKSTWSQAWATKIIKRAFKVYSRDMQSANVLENMCSKHVSVVTDVAFGLPYKTKELEQNGKIKVAFNPSGLLWKGGYTGNNQFDLSIDYQEYCKNVISKLTSDSRYEVYLIPHVGGGSENGSENDYGVCKKLHELFPDSHVVGEINSPIDAKDYISAMDVLIAARMHATVAGVSTGCATIPVAYSRKFMGLYENIGYDYVLDVKTLDTESAVNQTLEWVLDYKKLQAAADSSQRHVQDKLQAFQEDLIDIFKAI
ncbi:MAG: polysaccharide pyruvyl transferase family protein [Butyrivibrio sp.]|uniref:polysaccharide pyruvyl transferase family protein n=1 Tax=Butyrivibrio sp. TaxID=28121 RepID=UPI0025B86FD3|nr:polysaccharide pyruvyl transferase family protein [Butyrivibrio sp.]MBQ6587581.1 polysaccharide pyruvyl transferase family protein [Butyrivibrio sp.]